MPPGFHPSLSERHVLNDTRESQTLTTCNSQVDQNAQKEYSAKVITGICASQLTASMRRIPVGFYVAIQFHGVKWRTTNKPAEVMNDVVEWNDVIPLPLERAAIIRLGIYASFEFSPMLGKGELLHSLEVTTAELLGGLELTFLPRAEQLVSSCSSLLITVEDRGCERNYSVAAPQSQSSNPDGVRLERVTDIGHSYLCCFRELGEQQWLQRSIEEFEHALNICPLDHPYRAAALSNLAMAKFIECQVTGASVDLDATISLYSQAQTLRPAGHPDLPATLLHLAIAFLARFQSHRHLDDVFIASQLLEQVLQYNSIESYEYRSAVLAVEMYMAWIAADNQGIRWTRALKLVEQDYASDFLESYQHHRDPLNLEIGISIYEAYMQSNPVKDSKHGSHLVNLSTGFLHRFEHKGDAADLNKAISRLEEALLLMSDDHPSRSACLSNIGICFTTRFRLLGELEDLNQSISSFQDAVRLAPEGASNRAPWLTNLGIALRTRFRHTGDLRDLDKAISNQEEAVRLMPGDARRAGLLSNLGSSLRTRFDYLGDISDLHQAITRQEEAVRIIPDSNYHLPACLNNLGISLGARFNLSGDPSDLDQAISVQDRAVRLTPEGHQDRPRWLGGLGTSLRIRFEHSGIASDIEQAIAKDEEAVQLTKDSSPELAQALNNLGSSFLSRFSRLGDLGDFGQAVSKLEDAARLTPDGHPLKVVYLFNLAQSFFEGNIVTNSHSALQNALINFSRSACNSTGPSSTRFRAARGWIECAHRLSDDSLLEAYSVTIDMLPQLAWIGLPLRERHRRLLEAAEVVCDAASTALELGRPSTAVEWLEQGRSVVWGELLQLRTPLDELHAKHPVLADQLRQVSNALEHASAPDKSVDAGRMTNVRGNVRGPSLEEQARMYHELALERERILVEVRSQPGFKRFLLGKTVDQLSASARHGPVVILNASHRRCDALLLVSGVDEVLHVPLHDITLTQAVDLQKALEKLLEYGGRDIIESVSQTSSSTVIQDEEVQRSLAALLGHGDRDLVADHRAARPARLSNDAWFQEILSSLWTKVVKPVLDALGPSTPGELRRIFWCPTGPFSFLPIHAAGQYDATEPGLKLSDFAISSYTPTLSALAPPPPQAVHDAKKHIRLLAVRQPTSDGQSQLPGTHTELEHINTVLDSQPSPHVSLIESNGTVEDVLAKMKASEWVHFACHGVQDLANPLDSGLLLADRRRLKLSNIIQLSRARGGLAFLSACQTATGDRKLSEEAVHLAAGMLLAGYSSVIGTMWSIGDRDAPEVAKAVYEELLQGQGGPSNEESARALHHAVQRLRQRSRVSFISWVPFIHIGL